MIKEFLDINVEDEDEDYVDASYDYVSVGSLQYPVCREYSEFQKYILDNGDYPNIIEEDEEDDGLWMRPSQILKEFKAFLKRPKEENKPKPKIVFQKQIWNEFGYTEFITDMSEKFDMTEVSIIPFTNTLEPEIDFVPDLVFGSGRMVNIARERGWPTFNSFEPIELQYYDKHLWLNGDNEELTVGDFDDLDQQDYLALKYDDQLFVKPIKEKLFTGCVVYPKSLVDQVQFATSETSNVLKEKVIVSHARRIASEYRTIIIDGEFITGSLYKKNGIARYAPIDICDYYPDVKHFFKEHGIPEGFTGTIDLCKTGDGDMLIIEMNNLNSAGLYHSNYDAIMHKLHGRIKS